MGYRVVYKSRTQWQGSELECGDTGVIHETKEEAEAEKAQIENDPKNDIDAAAAEAQGLEGWLEIVEDKD